MLPDVVSASSLQSAAASERASLTPPTEAWEYSWRYIFSMFTRQRRALVAAQTVAVLAALFSVPLPLLMPLLVDEVLIGDSGPVVAAMRCIFLLF